MGWDENMGMRGIGGFCQEPRYKQPGYGEEGIIWDKDLPALTHTKSEGLNKIEAALYLGGWGPCGGSQCWGPSLLPSCCSTIPWSWWSSQWREGWEGLGSFQWAAPALLPPFPWPELSHVTLLQESLENIVSVMGTTCPRCLKKMDRHENSGQSWRIW